MQENEVKNNKCNPRKPGPHEIEKSQFIPKPLKTLKLLKTRGPVHGSRKIMDLTVRTSDISQYKATQDQREAKRINQERTIVEIERKVNK